MGIPMTADDVVVLTWYGVEEPLHELSNLISARIAHALMLGSTARVRVLAGAGESIDLSAIPEAAIVFPVAIGRASSGWLQGQLEGADLTYVGSGSRACEAAFDERVLRARLMQAGLSVAAYLNCERRDYPWTKAPLAVRSFPQGCPVTASPEEGPAASAALVPEQKRSGGRTFSLASLRDADRVASLPVVEVLQSVNASEPATLYSPWDTGYVCPAAIDDRLRFALDRIAVAAHNALGCVMSRVQVHLDGDDALTVRVFEAAPLLLPTSLFARAAAGVGLDFADLARRLVDDARQHRT